MGGTIDAIAAVVYNGARPHRACQSGLFMAPCVSVIMPVRDGARWIGEALASLQAQSFADFELIVVDDGSQDRTAHIVAQAQGDARIRLLPQPPLGLVAALNRGLEAAHGEFIARLDADDRAHPARLARQVELLRAQPELGLIGSWAEIIDADGRTLGRLRPPADPDALATMLMWRNPMLHSSTMWRADLTARVGRYRAAFEAAEDYDLWLRMAEHGRIANIPEYLLQYRRHDAGVTGRRKLRQLFSARLARRAATARRRHGVDPAAALTGPPDWTTASDGDFFAADARLYRFLEWAEPRAFPGEPPPDFDLTAALLDEFGLTHDERRLAQLALLNILRAGRARPARQRARLAWQFLRLHPARAVALACGADQAAGGRSASSSS
jgi:glycosyltransferase involved in cell wall biosynthesis